MSGGKESFSRSIFTSPAIAKEHFECTAAKTGANFSSHMPFPAGSESG